MNFLVIYSHPSPLSFNHAIKETLVSQLKLRGQEVRVRDLYALEFNPVLRAEEIEGFKKGLVRDDVGREQDQIRWANILIFICPIWWGGFTASLRGYLDRVFSLNFAYAETPEGVKGLLSDKKVVTINTLGAPRQIYEEMGLFNCMDNILDNIVFRFCGLESIGRKYFSFVGGCSDAERLAMLQEVKVIADRLSSPQVP